MLLRLILPTLDCLSPFDFGLFVKGGLMGDIIILESSSLFFSRGVCLSTLRRFACLALEPEPKAGMAISSAKIGSDTGLDKDCRSGIVPMLLPLEEGCDPTPRSLEGSPRCPKGAREDPLLEVLCDPRADAVAQALHYFRSVQVTREEGFVRLRCSRSKV